LHRFVIHGKDYGINGSGGGFADGPHQGPPGQFGFRVAERYDYDFRDGWQHDVRVEAIHAVDPTDPPRPYPVCLGGRRAAPPGISDYELLDAAYGMR